MSIASGGAAVTVTIDDLTAPGLRSALRNLTQLETAAKRAGDAAARASASIQRVAGRGFVMQPFSGASRLELLNQGGGNQITPMAAQPYALAQPGLDAIKRRAEARRQMQFGSRDVGFLPPRDVASTKTVAEAMRMAAASAKDMRASLSLASGVSAKFATRIAGAGIAFGGVSALFAAAVDAIEDKARGASNSFWESFQLRLSDAVRNIPVIGSVFRAVFASQYAELDRLKGEIEELATAGAKQRELVEARMRGASESDRSIRRSNLDVSDAELEASSRGFETEQSLDQWRRTARQRAQIEAEEFEIQQRQRAVQEGVSEDSVGIGQVRFRQLLEESRIRASNARELIEIEYQERLRRVQGEKQERIRAAEDEAQAAAAARLAAERDVAARLEELQLDQQDRLALARLDLEEQSLRAADTPASRVRQAEIEAQRQLIALQQQLDDAEARILAEKGLTAEQRDAAIAAERQIAELQASKIREASDRIAAGDARTEQASLAAGGGTFSSFAASRINTDSTALMREQVKFLQRIASNTAQAQGFGP